MMAITAKELDLRGSFRFHEEFATGVSLMRNGLIDVKPLITHTVRLEDALSAFEIASDRSRAMKAQIAFFLTPSLQGGQTRPLLLRLLGSGQLRREASPVALGAELYYDCE